MAGTFGTNKELINLINRCNRIFNEHFVWKLKNLLGQLHAGFNPTNSEPRYTSNGRQEIKQINACS